MGLQLSMENLGTIFWVMNKCTCFKGPAVTKETGMGMYI
jgi:hypothetical protein